MTTEPWAFGLAIVGSLLAGLGPFYLKRGAEKIKSLKDIFPAPPAKLVAGIFFHGLAAVIFVLALRGGEVSVLYPVVAFHYVIAAWLGSRYLGERVTKLRWAAIVLIILGVAVLGMGNVG